MNNIEPNDDYIIELPDIQWDKDSVISYIYEQKHLWNNTGWFFVPTKNHPVFHNLLRQLKPLNVLITKSGFGRADPWGSIPPHTDPGKDACIFFPLIGDWENSPIIFNQDNIESTDKKYAVCSHVYTCPTVVNTSKIHYVENNSNQERITFSFSFFGLNWNQTRSIIKEKYLGKQHV